MKTIQRIAIAIVALLSLAPATGTAQLFMQMYQGYMYDRTALDVWRTSNGEYLIAGLSNNSNPADADLYVMLTDANGVKLWDTTYGGGKPDFAYHMAETSDGNYIIAGHTQSFGGGDMDIYLLKITNKGKFIAQRNVDFGPGKNDEARQILRMADNTFLVIGSSGIGSTSTKSQMVLLHINGDLSDAEQARFYGGADNDYGLSIAQASDGGYLLGGQTWSEGSGRGDAWVVKVKGDFSTDWTKTYGSDLAEEVVGIVGNSDGTAMLAIRDSVGGGTPDGNIDVVLTKIGSDGSVLVNKQYGDYDKDTPKCIAAVPSGGYIVGAISRGQWQGTPQMWLLRTDGDGNITWIQSYGDVFEHDHVHRIKPSHDNGFILVGHRRDAGVMKIVFMKIDEGGNVGLNEFANANNVLTLYPNPSRGGEFTVQFKEQGTYELTAYNSMGAVVYNEAISSKNGERATVRLNGAARGMYLLKVKTSKGVAAARVLVE